MNFAAFQLWREETLRANPDVLDCGEINLYRTLTALQPGPVAANPLRQIYRCDLARAWLRRYGFAETLSRRALVCRGVRHALCIIFRKVAADGSVVWLPDDVYPVYLELAREAGLEPKLFTALPSPELPDEAAPGTAEYLLVANPWKPLGRFLLEKECDSLIAWLAAGPQRRLILDCVYDFGTPFHSTTRRLWDTGRSVVLHSVTKGWLWPKTFGVALMPDEQPRLESAFRSEPPSQDQLALAEKLVSTDAELPNRIVSELAARQQNLLAALAAPVRKQLLLDAAVLAPGCYFFAVAMPTEELLKQHRLVAIPASAFGNGWSGSVLTSLSPAFTQNGNGGRK